MFGSENVNNMFGQNELVESLMSLIRTRQRKFISFAFAANGHVVSSYICRNMHGLRVCVLLKVECQIFVTLQF